MWVVFIVVLLVMDFFIIANTVNSRLSTAKKVIWVLAVVLLPVVAHILWFLKGPRSGGPE